MASDPLDSGHLIGHVKDADYFEVPRFMAEQLGGHAGHVPVPQVYEGEPVWGGIGTLVEPLDLHITKFMVLEVVAAVIMVVLFVWLANRMSRSDRPKGRIWNFLETMLVFIRDEVARPAIGKHDADKFLPFLWTLFFFVLGCNLLGMLPWLGSPTGAIATTGALAITTFAVVVGSGMSKMGFIGFFKSLVPHMDLPKPIAIFLLPMIFAIEVLGLLIKHFVLSVRLVANMLAGHLVLGVLVAFIAAAYHSNWFYAVAPASILGATALSMLELFVAFLQAYIFTFLSALFIGMAVHPH
ncbi:MAG: F0F1 ATP synthase subunit A [Pirellulaceae bacterium]